MGHSATLPRWEYQLVSKSLAFLESQIATGLPPEDVIEAAFGKTVCSPHPLTWQNPRAHEQVPEPARAAFLEAL